MDRTLRYREGFSLVELLVVIAILAVLLGISIGVSSSWIHKSKVRSFAESIVSNLYWAKTLAIEKGSSRVSFDSEARKYYIYSPSENSTPVFQESYPDFLEVKVSDSFPSDGTSKEIRFRSSGLPENSGNIDIVGAGVEYKIEVNNISGRIKLERIK